ncbi:MAG: DUF2298 domain-containing protein [Chloroflexota bacterium]|nr:DUF2298 domain-containing protein [Chloroflexota bacterium]
MILRLLLWYFSIMVLGWATFPISFSLLSKLPDRGYTLSRILGLLLWGFCYWLLGSLGVLQNKPGSILLVLVLLILISFWFGWKKRQEISDWLKANLRLILISEMVFTVSFAFMTLVRASDPSATGTEKPMELAFINAILNSERFPPHDPWLSGYAISYYHFGYILTGMLAKVTFTSGGIAFNLMLVSTFAMSAVGSYGILYNLLRTYRKQFHGSFESLSWALFGPLFLLMVSNLEGVLEILHQAGLGWDMESGTSRFWQWVNIDSLRNSPSQPLSLIPQRFWWWWQASRVIQDIDLLGNISGLSPIDEFPAFSFLLGDLHPHVLVMPFVMLVVGLAIQVFWGGMEKDESNSGLGFPYRLDMFFILAITLGGIAFLNTWDLPVYFGLIVSAYFLQRLSKQGWHWNRLIELLWFAIPLGIVSLLLYAPFFIGLQSQAGGILPNMIYPTRGLYLWLMFGTLFIPLFLFLIHLKHKHSPAEWKSSVLIVFFLLVALLLLSLGIGYGLSQTQPGQQVIASQGGTTFLGLLPSALLHRLRYGVSLLTLTALLVVGLSYLLGLTNPQNNTASEKGSIPFVLLLIVLGGLMVLAPEFVYLQDNFSARMNTIFKFYYQAWMLWSLGAAFAAVVVLKKSTWISKIILSVFIIFGLVYPILAFPSKTNGFSPSRGFTLDAGDYLTQQQPLEAEAIAWLSQAANGVVVEAVGGQYSGYARVSTLSGQPTVLGWPGHEGQWRGGYEEVGSRESDIRVLYETHNWLTALEIIQRYDIRYIYIGSLEMSTYAFIPLKFEQHLQAGFEKGDIRIYIVPQTLLE